MLDMKPNYSTIGLTKTEQRFLDSFMDPEIHPGHALYWTTIKAWLERFKQEYADQETLVTNQVFKLSEEILYKIGMKEAEACVEEIINGNS